MSFPDLASATRFHLIIAGESLVLESAELIIAAYSKSGIESFGPSVKITRFTCGRKPTY